MKNIAVYVRESKHKKDTVDVERIKIKIVKHFHSAEPIVYFDSGYPGSNLDRPDIKRLLADIKNKEIDVLFIDELRMLSRDIKDWAEVLEILKESNVALFFRTDDEIVEIDLESGKPVIEDLII